MGGRGKVAGASSQTHKILFKIPPLGLGLCPRGGTDHSDDVNIELL
jgi:hypothetical protein